jgi:hypothetical protein
VVIGPPTVDVGDAPHPLTDGIVFGTDLMRGRTLKFAGAHFGPSPAATRPWTDTLDLADPLEAAWNAESLRRQNEAVAKLTNLDRGRAVYGRPRNYAPDLAKVRRGWSEWTADFVTVDDRFYGATTTEVLEDPEIMPTTPEKDVVPAAPQVSGLVAGGTHASWPVITIQGVMDWPMVTFYDADDEVMFKVGLRGNLGDEKFRIGAPGSDGIAVFDARPWKLGLVTVNGIHYPGRLLGSPLRQAFIPPGVFGLAFSCVTVTGAPTATVSWESTYGSM